MPTGAVDRVRAKEYRGIVSDNLRWDQFVPRPDDIFVCTPPKCGTTWMQTIVVSLLFPNGDAPGPVMEIAPWLDARFEPIDVIIDRLDAQTFRRSIKTHTSADGIPWFSSASYIVVGRDGRDAFMSFLNHMRNIQPVLFGQLATSAFEEGIPLEGRVPPVDDVHEFYDWWLNEAPMWFEHVASFWDHRDEANVLFVHYDDLKADLELEMRRIAAFLHIDLEDEQWPAVVDRCTFESMKKRSAEIADFEAHFIGGADTFLYKGTNGRWRDVLTAQEVEAFHRRSKELLLPDAIAWTTSGRRGAAELL
jgi:aryl sulfotransferase